MRNVSGGIVEGYEKVDCPGGLVSDEPVYFHGVGILALLLVLTKHVLSWLVVSSLLDSMGMVSKYLVGSRTRSRLEEH